MNLQEALGFLQVEAVEDIADALELQLFTIKQDFISKPLLAVTAKSRIQKLNKLKEVEVLLAIPSSSGELKLELKADLSKIQLFWENYMRAKLEWKTQLSKAESASEILALIDRGFELELYFSKQVPALDWTTEEVVFGQEPDAMEVQKAIQLAARFECFTFEEIYQHKNKFPLSLLKALKRLSLLPKYLVL